mmetsp:Transcript_8969/g.10401  ORF Transcript_8969/g.10401 Transcript_8969/m.10401 type:complete len:215 (+) Transcript_8969:215-859(+)
MKVVQIFAAGVALLATSASAFTIYSNQVVKTVPSTSEKIMIISPLNKMNTIRNVKKSSSSTTTLQVTPDLEVVSLVAGQENYGLGIVALGEALWSFLEAPSFSHAKVLVPAIIAAAVLFAVSGPMVTNSSDPAAIKLGLEIATGVSVFLGASYVARLLAPFSPSAKEIAFGGLLVAVAGFFSFSQNLVVDEFVTLPSIPLPSLPTIEFPQIDFD